MSAAVRGLHAARIYLEMIKIEHSIFALPFAMIGMVCASQATLGSPWPGTRIFILIVIAMVSCRSAAMAWNRIADRDIDVLNERTKMRAIPSGLLSLRSASVYFWTSVAVFVLAAGLLNSLTLMLSPIALVVTIGYSYMKRFTPICHLVLGLSLGIAPAAAWIAVTGTLDLRILFLVAAVMFWTAGFDILYSLQDEAFDREHHLRSIPETFGIRRALGISRLFHLCAIGFLCFFALSFQLEIWAWVGIAFAATLLGYEQSLVKPGDLSRINLAFFTLNGFVSIGLFAFVLADLLLRSFI